MENKKTGFWVRLLARALDLIIILTLSAMSAYLSMHHDTNGWHFNNSWIYYVWSLQTIALIFIWFIIIPSIWRRTFFMWVLRIEIQFKNEHKFKSILIREGFFAIVWIIMITLMILIINHTLIEKFAKTDKSKNILSDLEKLRTGIVTAVGSVLVVVQFIYAISIFVRGNKKGLHDSQSNTYTVWSNRFINKPEIKKVDSTIKPKPVNNNPVDWV